MLSCMHYCERRVTSWRRFRSNVTNVRHTTIWKDDATADWTLIRVFDVEILGIVYVLTVSHRKTCFGKISAGNQAISTGRCDHSLLTISQRAAARVVAVDTFQSLDWPPALGTNVEQIRCAKPTHNYYPSCNSQRTRQFCPGQNWNRLFVSLLLYNKITFSILHACSGVYV